MRRVVSLSRPTTILRSRYSLALRPTNPLYIPPQLARLLVAGGVLLFQVFITAHQRESEKLRRESDDTIHNGNNNNNSSSGSKVLMSSSEALQILGLNHNLSVPLQNERDKEEAKRRFNRLFKIAKETDNLYLQGKFSAAYRVCVDTDWDNKDSSSYNNNNNNIGENTK